MPFHKGESTVKAKTGKKLYSLKEAYRIFFDGIRTMNYMVKSRKNGELDLPNIERIMLAVTEVNGCAICSYAHTKIALEAGMDNEEIQNLLAGDFDTVPKEELKGVVFAQHYADSRGKPSRASWEQLKAEYGSSKAFGILGAIRTIMIGNTLGIPWSSFRNRLKGNADSRSSLGYEIAMMTFGTLLIPVALVHAAVSILIRRPPIAFANL
jgi:AhpD family alkylhydroperoxidase